MPLEPAISIDRLRGLRLDAPLATIGPDSAIDLLDVDWAGGVLGSRPGASTFTKAAGPANYEAIFPHSDSRLLAVRGETLVALDQATGKELESTIEISDGAGKSFARMGEPNSSYTYFADSVFNIKRFDGTIFTSPTATVDGVAGKAMPIAGSVAVWPDGGNRLVSTGTGAFSEPGTFVGGPGGAVSSPSHVWFSEPGNAESYESTAYVQIHPGDGEISIGCVQWGGQIFVFKETKFFVFYGVSADGEGKPIFNFREVSLGSRIVPKGIAGQTIVAGDEGVYFVAHDGLYVTTGGAPTLLSEALNPLASTRPLAGPVATTLGGLRWTDAKVVAIDSGAAYVGLGESHTTRLLKLDFSTFNWTIYSAALNAMVIWNEEVEKHRQRLFFSGAAAGKEHIYYYTPAVNEDPTVAMDPRWQSGGYDLGSPDEKTLTKTKLWGSGTVALAVAQDFGDPGKAKTFKLGAGSVVTQSQQQRGQSATIFSHKISGAAPWSVQRLTRYLRETRVAATQRKS